MGKCHPVAGNRKPRGKNREAYTKQTSTLSPELRLLTLDLGIHNISKCIAD